MMMMRAIANYASSTSRHAPARATPEAVPAVPRTPVDRRAALGGVARLIESLATHHRAVLVLFFAYVSFFHQIFRDLWKEPAELEMCDSTGVQLLDPESSEPLTRAAVLARSRVSTNSTKGVRMRRGALQRQGSEEQIADPDDDEIVVLHRAIDHAKQNLQGPARARELSNIYAAIANVHSERGQYYEALMSMNLSVGAAEAADEDRALPDAHVRFAFMELKHFRYFAAESRFEDAYAFSAALDNASMGTFLSGWGWAAAMQRGGAQRAEQHLVAAMGRLGSARTVENPFLCQPRFDGLDSSRMLALAGLCLVRRNATRAGSQHLAIHFCECGSRLRAADIEPVSRRALGFAWQGLMAHTAIANSAGDLDARAAIAAARREMRQAHAQESRLTASPDSCIRHLAEASSLASVGSRIRQGGAELVQCAQSAFHSGLTEYIAGDTARGLGFIDILLESVARAASSSQTQGNRAAASDLEEEAAEWLQRFVRAMLATLGASQIGQFSRALRQHCFATLLLTRAVPLLLRSGAAGAAVRQEPRLARLVAELRHLLAEPQGCSEAHVDALTRLQAASEALDTPAAGPDGDFGWPSSQIVALRRLLSDLHYQRGDTGQATEVLERAIDSGGTELSAELAAAYADLAAIRLQEAGQDPLRWRLAVDTFRDGLRRLTSDGPVQHVELAQTLKAGYTHSLRLAHRRGVYNTCPGPLDELLYGMTCRP